MATRPNSILGGAIARRVFGDKPKHVAYVGYDVIYNPRKSGAGVLRIFCEGIPPIEYNRPSIRRYIRKNSGESMMRDIGRTVTAFRRRAEEYKRIAHNAARINKAAKPYIDDPTFLDYVEKQEAIHGSSDYATMTDDRTNLWLGIIKNWKNKGS